MNLTIKIFILALGLFCACSEKKSPTGGYLKIEHVGPRDKPITTLIVATNEIPQKEWEKVIIVDQKLFGKIYALVRRLENALNLKSNHEENRDEWAVFRVTTYSSNESLSYFTSTGTESGQFFEGLSRMIQSGEQNYQTDLILHELQILRKRIGYTQK